MGEMVNGKDEVPDSQNDGRADGAAVANGVERGERSATRYPFYDLGQAEAFAAAVRETGGSTVLENDLLKHLQVSKTTKSWVYKLSTAREFGLIERHSDKAGAQIVLTDLGERILKPAGPDELYASRFAAFCTPKLYAALYESYRGKTLPKAQFLANVLSREPYKLVESVTEQAAGAFWIPLGMRNSWKATFCLNAPASPSQITRRPRTHPAKAPRTTRRWPMGSFAEHARFGKVRWRSTSTCQGI
jgi:hypothetical protein